MNKKRFLLFGACLLFSGVVTAHAVELDVDVECELKATSAYIWRGQVLNDKACFQPSVMVKGGGLSFSVDGSWDVEYETNSSERARVDAALSYAHAFGKNEKVIVKSGLVGYVYYDDFDGDNKDTFEIFIDYILDIPLLPSLTVYYDFVEVESFYATFALGHTFQLIKERPDKERLNKNRPIKRSLALDISASISGADEKFNNNVFSFTAAETGRAEDFVPDEASLVDFKASASLPLSIGKHFEIMPAVKYMTLLDPEIKDAVKDAGEKDSEIAYSLSLSLYF